MLSLVLERLLSDCPLVLELPSPLCAMPAVNKTLAMEPAVQRLKTSQRDQNLAALSAAQSVAGAPLLQVNEAGAPANVAAPHVQPAAPEVRNHLLHPRVRRASRTIPEGAPLDVAESLIGTRLKRILMASGEQPPLGCSRCRYKDEGCTQCMRYRELWCVLHPPQQS